MKAQFATVLFAAAVSLALPACSTGSPEAQAQREPAPTEAQANKPDMQGQMDRMNDPQMRQKMAKAHEEAAACLRTDTDMQKCHRQMMKNCREMGDGHCPMMKKGMGMMGEKHNSMAGDETSSETE